MHILSFSANNQNGLNSTDPTHLWKCTGWMDSFLAKYVSQYMCFEDGGSLFSNTWVRNQSQDIELGVALVIAHATAYDLYK